MWSAIRAGTPRTEPWTQRVKRVGARRRGLIAKEWPLEPVACPGEAHPVKTP
jgi:hypothetical protein